MLAIAKLRRLTAAVAVTGTVALAAAGCGGAQSSSGAADGAKALPADTLLYVSVNTDQGSDPWKRLQALGARFPGWTKLTSQLQAGLAAKDGSGTSFDQGVKPWLGGEVAIGLTKIVVPNSASGSPTADYVVYLATKDEGKAQDALKSSKGTVAAGDYQGYTLFHDTTSKAGDPAYAAVGKGAVLLSPSEAGLRGAIDLREGGGATLAGSSDFKAAMARVPSGALASGYLNAPALIGVAATAMQAQAAASGIGGSAAQLDRSISELRSTYTGTVAFGVVPEDGGIRIVGSAQVDGARAASGMTSFAPTLARLAPADTFVYLGFADLGKRLQKALDQAGAQSPQAAQQLAAFEQSLGISIASDLVPALTGEHALVISKGAPVSIALLLQPADAAKSIEPLKRLALGLKSLSPTAPRFVPTPGADGVNATFGPNEVLTIARTDSHIYIGNGSPQAAPAGSSLADSAAWKRLAAESKLPGKVASVVYVDVKGAVGAAQATGMSGQNPFGPVGGLMAWQALSGDQLDMQAFIEIPRQ